MQFNSYVFIFSFFPVFIVTYCIGNKINTKIGKYLLILFGLIFYYFAGIQSFAILLVDLFVNLSFAFLINRNRKTSKVFFVLSISANVLFLLFYKLIGFLSVSGMSFTEKNIIMPLGVSFFTFQQIMYLSGVYKNEIAGVDISDYLAYILFFPKLIMGPLAEPSDLISQINDPKLKKINMDNIAIGVKLLSFGLFKKMILADTFSKAVAWGFENLDYASSADLFLTMLFYTFEIYFDFSGYTDIAIGVSKIINIDLPMNFDSPYKAISVKDFWRRWHISLTKFFTKYIYYPLGGNRKGRIRTYVNIMIVFLISGLWHGANYTFILWGGVYGILQVIERLFEKQFNKLSETVKWIYTFGVVNVLWLLFRSDSIQQFKKIFYTIFTFRSTSISDGMLKTFDLPEKLVIFNVLHLQYFEHAIRGFSMLIFILSGFAICLIPENNYKNQKKLTIVNMVLASVALVWSILCLGEESIFVYFNF